MNVNERAEISASVAAHSELGPQYDSAVAEGLIERIGDEIDKRVDARVRAAQQPTPTPAPPPAPAAQSFPGAVGYPAAAPPPPYAPGAPGHAQTVVHRRSNGVTGMFLGLGSMGLGVGATAVVVANHVNAAAAIIMVALIWLVIMAINIAHSQRQ